MKNFRILLCGALIFSANITLTAMEPEAPQPITFGTFAQTDCAVCCVGMAGTGAVVLLGCGHAMHQRCFEPWMQRGIFTCPLCRAEDALYRAMMFLSDRMINSEMVYVAAEDYDVYVQQQAAAGVRCAEVRRHMTDEGEIVEANLEHLLTDEEWRVGLEQCITDDPTILHRSNGYGVTLLQHAFRCALDNHGRSDLMGGIGARDKALRAFIVRLIDDPRTNIKKGQLVAPMNRSLFLDFEESSADAVDPDDCDDLFGGEHFSPRLLAHKLGDPLIIQAMISRLQEPIELPFDLPVFTDSPHTPRTPDQSPRELVCPGAPRVDRTLLDLASSEDDESSGESESSSEDDDFAANFPPLHEGSK